MNENEGDRGVVGEREAANILKDVEAVTLNNVFFPKSQICVKKSKGEWTYAKQS